MAPRFFLALALLINTATNVLAQQDAPAGGEPASTQPAAPAEQPPQATAPAEQPPAAAPRPAAPTATVTTTPPPQEEEVVTDSNPLLNFLFFSWTGWILIICYIAFVTLLVLLTLDLRSGHFMPPHFVDDMEDAMNKRRFKEALEQAKQDDSLFGRVMTAGINRLPYGLQEARDAGAAMLENMKARKDALLSYVAILGTLGPLIGLVGTVAGMIATFAELGRGGTPRYDRLALGISHALNATLVGIFLSVLAIPAYSYFKNRLLRLILDADLLADDLLTQAYYAAKTTAPSSAPATPAATTPKE